MNVDNINNLSLKELFEYKGMLDELCKVYVDVASPYYSQLGDHSVFTAEQRDANNKLAKADTYIKAIIKAAEDKIYDEIDGVKNDKKTNKKN